LTKNEKENLAKIFKAIDKNGDGKLSKEEILDGYDKFFGKTMEKEDVLKMFEAVDIDQSGFIDYSEFVVAAMSEKTLLTDEKLLTTFKMFDKVSPPHFIFTNLCLIGRFRIHLGPGDQGDPQLR
jgi:calcium-dependent protein kinase